MARREINQRWSAEKLDHRTSFGRDESFPHFPSENFSRFDFQIAFNPLTAEGIDFLVEAVSSNRSSVSFLDISVKRDEFLGFPRLSAFSLQGTLISPSAARLAETIKDKREFSLKYDGELRSEHFLSQRNGEKAEISFRNEIFLYFQRTRTIR